MKLHRLVVVAVCLPWLAACSLGKVTTTSSLNGSDLVCAPLQARFAPTARPVGAAANYMPVDVGCGYFNEPCVSVTICEPGTSNCQTIPNILLDTGSSGLRIFSCNIGLNLPSKTDAGNNPMGECMSYAGGNQQWGGIKMADVQLGDQLASNVPIHVIDPNFAKAPPSCSELDLTPQRSGYNGVLGVGLTVADCGNFCALSSNNGTYYSCANGNCTNVSVSQVNQVRNPVAMLSADNNGVVLNFPAVPTSGSTRVTGSLYIGVGTRANNTPANTVKFFQANSVSEFSTSFNGTTMPGFIDSGSNVYFIPQIPALLSCNSNGIAPGFFCPASLLSLSATQIGYGNAPQQAINFNVINAESVLVSSNPNYVFNNIAADSQEMSFDWGFPFFLGRTIYVGIENRSIPSKATTGPYWGY